MAKQDKADAQLRCSFCGKGREEVRKLIAGPTVYICDECVDLCNDIIAEDLEGRQETISSKLPKPKEIMRTLDQYVIGQERAKKVLSVAVHNHYKRISSNTLDDVELQKGNILLIGPTGTGKTLLAQTLARILDVPFTIADATTLTEAGYVGEDVENIILKLVQAADYDVERAERGIVHIDEIDKISRTSDLLSQVQPEDLLKYGLIPEFVGRLPVAATLEELDEKSLIRILTEPKNALLKQCEKLLAFEKVKLKFTENAVVAVARKAFKQKTGARGLRSILEEVMLDVMYEIPSQREIRECVITEDVIEGKTSPLLIRDHEKGVKSA